MNKGEIVFLGYNDCYVAKNTYNNEVSISWKSYINIISKSIKEIRYGENYREVIQHKWDMRKLNRKLKLRLPEKDIKEGLRKI